MAVTLLTVLQIDSNFFNDIVIPQQLNKDDLIEEILNWCDTKECYYANTNLFKRKSDSWFRTHLKEFQDLYETTVQEYNIIHNYDRTDTESREVDRTEEETTSRNDVENSEDKRSGNNDKTTGGSSTDSGSGSRDTISTTAAFDASELVQTSGENVTETQTKNTEHNGEEKDTWGETGTGKRVVSEDGMTSRNGKDIETVSRHSEGNIGVTTTQQMLEAQRAVVMFNVYEVIAKKYHSKFFICV